MGEGESCSRNLSQTAEAEAYSSTTVLVLTKVAETLHLPRLKALQMKE